MYPVVLFTLQNMTTYIHLSLISLQLDLNTAIIKCKVNFQSTVNAFDFWVKNKMMGLNQQLNFELIVNLNLACKLGFGSLPF